jgi:hypothetical protein
MVKKIINGKLRITCKLSKILMIIKKKRITFMARWKKKKSSFDLAGHIFLPSTSLARKGN